ncbi:RNA polymerase sigma factor [Anseongella ginsenosidimutans]|nr:RNA polymerase sigma-70 factor [Anseongella ginsenosidimutans]
MPSFHQKIDIIVIEIMRAYCNCGDKELAQLLKEGDKAAYTELYNRYKGLLYVHAYRILQDKEEAKDVIQDLFIVLWTKREELNYRGGIASYLYASARNRVFDRIARKKVASSYFESLKDFAGHYECSTDKQLEEKELAAIIEKEISALPLKMREIFQLSRMENLSHKEIAEQLIISDKTVKKQVSNALKILRLKLGAFLFIIHLLPLTMLTVIY